MHRIVLAMLELIAAPGFADRRGESICGESPNTAIVVTRPFEDGRWWAHGPVARVRYPYHATERDAIKTAHPRRGNPPGFDTNELEQRLTERGLPLSPPFNPHAEPARERGRVVKEYGERLWESYWESLSPDCLADYSFNELTASFLLNGAPVFGPGACPRPRSRDGTRNHCKTRPRVGGSCPARCELARSSQHPLSPPKTCPRSLPKKERCGVIGSD